MRLEGSPPSTYPLTHYRWVEKKKVWKVTLLVTHRVLFSNQNSKSQDCKQIHCVLLCFVLVCWMSCLSRCLNGLLPEAVAVSQVITSAFSYMIYSSPHLSLLFCSFCCTQSHSHSDGKKLSRVTDTLLEKRLFRSSFHQDTRMLQENMQAAFWALLMALLSFRCIFGESCTGLMVNCIWYLQSGLSVFVPMCVAERRESWSKERLLSINNLKNQTIKHLNAV